MTKIKRFKQSLVPQGIASFSNGSTAYDYYCSTDSNFSSPSSIAQYTEAPNAEEDNRPYYTGKELFTQVAPDVVPEAYDKSPPANEFTPAAVLLPPFGTTELVPVEADQTPPVIPVTAASKSPLVINDSDVYPVE